MSILAGMRLVVFKHSGIWFIDKDPTDSNVSIQADLEGVYTSYQASDERYMSACLVVNTQSTVQRRASRAEHC